MLILLKDKEPGHKTWSTDLYNTVHILHPVKTTNMQNLGYREVAITSKFIYECMIHIIQMIESQTSRARPVPELELLHQFFYFLLSRHKGALPKIPGCQMKNLVT